MMSAFVVSAATSLFHGNSTHRTPRRVRIHATTARRQVAAKLDALLFDCDGVLADTERDAHRVAFNMAFKERGLQTVWDEALYGRLLETGGGKERMTAYWNSLGAWPAGVESQDDKWELVKSLHKRKTQLFMDLVAGGHVPLRDGVQRLVDEALAAGVSVGVCSTSNEKAVQKIVDMLGKTERVIQVFAGDVVKRKKPSPDIYNLAVERMEVEKERVCVVEDSFIGLRAARAADMACVVTKSTYTRDEDFDGAMMVLNSLDDPYTSLGVLTEMVERAEAVR